MGLVLLPAHPVATAAAAASCSVVDCPALLPRCPAAHQAISLASDPSWEQLLLEGEGDKGKGAKDKRQAVGGGLGGGGCVGQWRWAWAWAYSAACGGMWPTVLMRPVACWSGAAPLCCHFKCPPVCTPLCTAATLSALPCAQVHTQANHVQHKTPDKPADKTQGNQFHTKPSKLISRKT